MHKESRIRDQLIDGNKTFHDITVEVAYPVEGKANKYWWTLFGLSVILMLWGFGCIAYTIGTGIGVWGLNKTINWAWDITNLFGGLVLVTQELLFQRFFYFLGKNGGWL